MNYQLQIMPAAEADLAEAWAWYESQRDGLGDDLLLCVDAALAYIERAPTTPAKVYRAARRAMVRRFPYAVIYRVVGDHVQVLAFAHASRDPRVWMERVG